MDNLGKRVFGYFEKAHQEFHYHGVGMAALGAVTHPHLTASVAAADYAGHKLWAAVQPAQNNQTQQKQEAEHTGEHANNQRQQERAEIEAHRQETNQAEGLSPLPARQESLQGEARQQEAKEMQRQSREQIQPANYAERQKQEQPKPQQQVREQQIGQVF